MTSLSNKLFLNVNPTHPESVKIQSEISYKNYVEMCRNDIETFILEECKPSILNGGHALKLIINSELMKRKNFLKDIEKFKRYITEEGFFINQRNDNLILSKRVAPE